MSEGDADAFEQLAEQVKATACVQDCVASARLATCRTKATAMGRIVYKQARGSS